MRITTTPTPNKQTDQPAAHKRPFMRPSLHHISSRVRSRGGRIIAILLFIAGLLGTYQFGWRTYGSFLVLRSAYELGVPTISTVRAWMTLDYISTTYGVALPRLTAGLDLPLTTIATSALSEIADVRGLSRVDLVRATQAAIAKERAMVPIEATPLAERSDDAFLAALLTYSYPVLALVLLLGAIGAPVPTGFATILAGALVASGSMNGLVATTTAIVASVAGDIVGFAVGRLASERFIARYGRLAGYSGARKARIEWLFHRWGGATVLLTRTLVSHLSSLASLLAGLSGYALLAFVSFAVAGRVLWTAAYFGVGYYVGTDIEASSGFLANVTGLLIAGSLAGVSANQLLRWWKGPSQRRRSAAK